MECSQRTSLPHHDFHPPPRHHDQGSAAETMDRSRVRYHAPLAKLSTISPHRGGKDFDFSRPLVPYATPLSLSPRSPIVVRNMFSHKTYRAFQHVEVRQ